MKLPVPEEVLQRLDKTESNVVALRRSMEHIEELLEKLLTATYNVNGIDRPDDL